MTLPNKIVDKVIKTAWNSKAPSKCMLPQQSWVEKIFAPEVYCSVPRETNIFTTNNGTCEARLYLRGEEDIIGLHYDDVLGNTFREKRALFARMTIDNLQELAQEETASRIAVTART